MTHTVHLAVECDKLLVKYGYQATTYHIPALPHDILYCAWALHLSLNVNIVI